MRPKVEQWKTAECLKFKRALKKKATLAEKRMQWILDSLKVRSIFQKVMTPYIVDFYIPKPHRIVIEVDGPMHFTRNGMAYDKRRTKWIQLRYPGVRELRFSNDEVMNDVAVVIFQIKRALEDTQALKVIYQSWKLTDWLNKKRFKQLAER